MGKRTTRHTLAPGIGRLAGVIGVWILACAAPGAANTCEVRPPARRPPVEARQETATAARSRPRWTRSNDGELAANGLAIYDATEMNRTKETPMEHEHDTDHARNTEHKETDMQTDPTNNIGKTTTAKHKENNMSSEPKAKKKHPTMENRASERFLGRKPSTVLDHVPHAVHCCRTDGRDVLPWNHIDGFGLLPGGSSVLGSGRWNDLLHIEVYGVLKNTVEHSVLVNLFGWWPERVRQTDNSLLLFNSEGSVVQEFSCTDLTHQSTHSLGHLLLPGETSGDFFGVHGTRLVGLTAINVGRRQAIKDRTLIIDMDKEQVVSELGGGSGWEVIEGTQPAMLYRSDGCILGVDGRLVATLRLPNGHEIYSLAVGPGNAGFQGITRAVGNDAGEAELMVFDARGEVRAKTPLPDEFIETMVAVANSGRALVLTVDTLPQVPYCWSYVYGDNGYRLEGKCSLPYSAFLLQDDYLTSAVFGFRSREGALQFEVVDPTYGIRGLFSEE